MPHFPLRTSQTCYHRSLAVTRYADTFQYSVTLIHEVVVTFIYFKLCFAGLLAGMSRADRVSIGVQPAAGSAPQQHQRTKMCGQWCRSVLHPNGCERYQHLNPLMVMVGNGPRLQQKGVKVVTGVKASIAGISSQSSWCPCVPGWNQVSFFFLWSWKWQVLLIWTREKHQQQLLLTNAGSSWSYIFWVNIFF